MSPGLDKHWPHWIVTPHLAVYVLSSLQSSVRPSARSALLTSVLLMWGTLLRRCWLDGWINWTPIRLLLSSLRYSQLVSRLLGLSSVCIEDGQKWPWCLTEFQAEILGTSELGVWYAARNFPNSFLERMRWKRRMYVWREGRKLGNISSRQRRGDNILTGNCEWRSEVR